MNNQIFIPQTIIYDKFKELERINEFSQGWDNRWIHIKKGITQARLKIFTTPRIQFSSMSYSNGIKIEGSPPKGTVMISLIDTDDICNFNNKKIDKHELIIIRYGEELNYIASNKNTIFSIVIEEHFYDYMIERYFDKSIDTLRENHKFSVDPDDMNNFILQMEHWLIYFNKDENKILSMDIYLSIEEDIIDNLFSNIILKDKKRYKTKFDIIAARKILEENVENIYSINDLIDELNINARTLQYNFKEHLGITPKQYLHSLRLNAIKNELLNSDNLQTNISNIALKYGFFHHSHFSFEYKKLFGETPSDTLAK